MSNECQLRRSAFGAMPNLYPPIETTRATPHLFHPPEGRFARYRPGPTLRRRPEVDQGGPQTVSAFPITPLGIPRHHSTLRTNHTHRSGNTDLWMPRPPWRSQTRPRTSPWPIATAPRATCRLGGVNELGQRALSRPGACSAWRRSELPIKTALPLPCDATIDVYSHGGVSWNLS